MTQWRKSSRSSSGQEGSCVELARLTLAIGVRDSKNIALPHLALDSTTLGKLFDRIRSGELDL